MGHSDEVVRGMVDHFFKLYDANGNGKVEKQEFTGQFFKISENGWEDFLLVRVCN